MNRPLFIWTLYAVCVVLTFGALAWVTRTALALDEQREQARRQADQSKAVRLALYRMDTALAPALAAEAVRPPANYADLRQSRGTAHEFPFVSGRFEAVEVSADGSSIPTASSDVADALLTSPAFIAGFADAESRVARMASMSPWPGPAESSNRMQSVSQIFSNVSNNFTPNMRQELMIPFWAGDTLVLARRVVIDGRPRIQACRIDWLRLKESLLAGVEDLLPTADLIPGSSDGEPSETRLAALPVELRPGTLPKTADSSLRSLRVGLGLAWGGGAVAVLALGVALGAALSLSERRAAFVSAVTHELRTPLTTFRLYSDMLAEGLVTDEAKRRQYYETLRGEAIRLGHLVENVLAYARLERRRSAGKHLTMPLGKALEGVLESLSAGCERCGRPFELDVEPDALATRVRVDPAALERILTNLVDNACKHGTPFADPRIHARVRRIGASIEIEIADHGPGFAGVQQRRLFRLFGKSAQEAAGRAPGIGLGLALSRRLARRMDGSLSLLSPGTCGARLALRLKIGE